MVTCVYGLVLCQWIGFCIVNIHNGSVNGIISQTILFFFVLLLLHTVEQTIGFYDFYKKYNRWIFIMAVLGCLTWFLSTFFSFSSLYFLPDRAEPDRLIYNYGFTFAVQEDASELRYSGFFDEPGAMAYWGLYALLINRLFVKDKWLEIPLIVCLLLTFSMGFYIQIVIYIILFSISKKNIGSSILLAAVLLFGVILVDSTKGTDLNFVYDMSIGRLESMQESDNSISLDNRTESTEKAREEFYKNPLLGTNKLDINIGNNIYEPLALYGILGSFLILYPFIWLFFSAIKNKQYDVLKAVIVLFVGFAHRPFHNNLLYYFVLYGFIILYYNRLFRNNQLFQ